MVDKTASSTSNLYESIAGEKQDFDILSPSGQSIGSAVLYSEEGPPIKECTFQPISHLSKGLLGADGKLRYVADSLNKAAASKPTDRMDSAMSSQDRYIDARLEGIESKLDARMEAMQRFQEQAEARLERARQESDARFEKAEERFDSRVGEVLQEMRETRRHVSVMSATTIGVTVGSVIAALAVAVTLMASQINEQGAWLRDSVNRIEQRVEARPASASPTRLEATPPEAAE